MASTVPALPAELWLQIAALLPTADSLARLTLALGHLVHPADYEPAWRRMVLERWGCAPQEVHKPWRRFYAERLEREQQRSRIFYVCMSNGAAVVAEACVAAGGYPALWRSSLAKRCAATRPRWIEHSGKELGLCLTDVHRADLEERHVEDAWGYDRGDVRNLIGFDVLCCSLREGDGVHRLGCLSYFRHEEGPGGDRRAAAAAHADCFLRRMHERFVYEDFVARLPPLPSPPAAAAAAAAAATPPTAEPGDALARALRELALPNAAAAGGRATLALDLALELELGAWQLRTGSPLQRDAAGGLSLTPPAPPAGPTPLSEALQRLSLTQSGLLRQLQEQQGQQGQLPAAGSSTQGLGALPTE